MADKKCVGCGNEVRFKLTTNITTHGQIVEELYCADCMGHVFQNEDEIIFKVEAI